MSYKLACDLSSRIAAVVSVTGSMTNETTDGCNPTHPTSVAQIHFAQFHFARYDLLGAHALGSLIGLALPINLVIVIIRTAEVTATISIITILARMMIFQVIAVIVQMAMSISASITIIVA